MPLSNMHFPHIELGESREIRWVLRQRRGCGGSIISARGLRTEARAQAETDRHSCRRSKDTDSERVDR